MLVSVVMFKHGFDWRTVFLYKTEIFRKKCSYSILEVWLYWNHSKRTEIKSRLIENYNKLLTITNSNSNFHLHVSFPILIIKSQRNHSNKTQPSCPTRAAACASGSPAGASEQEAGLDANTHAHDITWRGSKPVNGSHCSQESGGDRSAIWEKMLAFSKPTSYVPVFLILHIAAYGSSTYKKVLTIWVHCPKHLTNIT